MTTIRRALAVDVLGLLATAPGARADSPGELGEQLRKATAVLSEMASGKQDTDIPREMLHGQGVMSVRRLGDGGWSSSAFFTVGGGSFGVQLGGQVIDLVLIVMTEKGLESLLKSDDVLLGGRYAVPAAGRAFANVLTTYSPPPKKR